MFLFITLYRLWGAPNFLYSGYWGLRKTTEIVLARFTACSKLTYSYLLIRKLSKISFI